MSVINYMALIGLVPLTLGPVQSNISIDCCFLQESSSRLVNSVPAELFLVSMVSEQGHMAC